MTIYWILLLIKLTSCVCGEHLLKCPLSPVTAAVGQDATFDFHCEPELDVTQCSVEWKFNTSIYVLVYRSNGFSENVQDKQFKGRASLDSSWSLTEGKLPLKISNVTTDDVGTYSCTVRCKEKIISCSTELISGNPEENGNKEDQTDSGYYGFIALIIIPVVAMVAFFIRKKRGKKNLHGGPDVAQPQEAVALKAVKIPPV